jgi:hypothetical protein
MSDKDKLVILALFFIFLISFFVFFIVLGDRPDSRLFQYLFFIAALTMAFTGFLGATGTFTTQGQTLGGGAAIFLILVLAVVGLMPYFEKDNSLIELVSLMKTNPTEELSVNDAIQRSLNQIEDLRETSGELKQCSEKLTLLKVKPDQKKLSLAIRYWDPPNKPIKPDDDLFTIDTGNVSYEEKAGKYELPVKDLSDNFVYIEPRHSDQLSFGPGMLLKYDDGIPEVQLFVKRK